MKSLLFLYKIVIVSCLIVNTSIQSHGVSAHTKVYTQQGLIYMQALCERVCTNKKPALYSYKLSIRSKHRAHAISAGRSVSNCYYEIFFDNSCSADITCTPYSNFS